MTDEDSTPIGDARRSRPTTEESYGVPDDREGLLSWTAVEEKLAGDRAYWVATIRPDGTPHVRPTWGFWVAGAFYCGGGERTRWVRNLAGNPEIVVHREDAEDVVIVEGTAERVDEETATPELVGRLDAAYEKKYDVRHGTPFFRVRPKAVFAWSAFPTDATRWTFETTDE